MKEFGLYIHIPFCMRKCNYCDFLSTPASLDIQAQYVEALKKEIHLTKEKSQGMIKTIFFGGGTPSVLEDYQMEDLMDTILSSFQVKEDAEISIEVNPGIIKRKKLVTYRKSGINRISMGLQSTNNRELKILGRIHTYEEFEKNYELARDVGFDNINVDLMLAIPNQTKEGLQQGIQKLINLRPDHISVYSLILEEGTLFYKIQDQLKLPSEEEEREMYWLADEYLLKNRYRPYEISNYALEGKECKHNLLYWSDEEFIGLGIGAASYWEGRRWKNTDKIKDYIKSSIPSEIRKITQEKDAQKHLEEYLFLGLRKREGISVAKLNQTFAGTIPNPLELKYAKEVKDFMQKGWMEIKDGYIRLTKEGIDYSNVVFASFLE